jgi:hypothetical protein
MRRILAAFAALIVAGAMLGGCDVANLATTTVDTSKAANTVLATKTAYEAVLVVAVDYNNLPRCGASTSPPLCSDAGVVAQLRKADVAASAAISAAENAVRTLGTSATVITAAVVTATNAVAALQSIVTTYGIK